MPDVIAERPGRVGLLSLNRPQAHNALSLGMVRELTTALLAWRNDPQVLAVAIRGVGKSGPFGVFSAGGDIRYFHRAAHAGDPTLEDFFTEEYTLNHLVHTYPKPFIAFMDGIVFGGGMGIAQGASLRVVTERTRMAMPETLIGLFPDVGGGYFLSRCPGHVGEFLALSGQEIGGYAAVAARLADGVVDADGLPALWAMLAETGFASPDDISHLVDSKFIATNQESTWTQGQFDSFFALESLTAIVAALEAAHSPWADETAAALRRRSPLLLAVTLEQIRRARAMVVADDLRMERDMVRHCFHTAHLGRSGGATDTVEGIRALVIDKDHAPRWNPRRIEDVTPDMVTPFFTSPWPAHAHPLRHLR
jgi:enoyl-CoA hydratase/carnithine racemase